jgi:hypothetical protein
MHLLSSAVRTRLLCSAAMLATFVACRGGTRISAADMPNDTAVLSVLPTELSSTSVLAKPPMLDTARVAGVARGVAVVGLLNQTAPCFALFSTATRTGGHVVIRMTAKEKPGTCATFAAGAFDYDVAVTLLAPGTYDVDILHRVEFKDGTVAEKKVGGRRVVVTAE